MTSILCDWQIKKFCNMELIKISPYDEDLVNPASLDIRLGEHFTVTESNYKTQEQEMHYIDPLDKKSFTSYTFHLPEGYMLPPGATVLASMMEDITLPAQVSAKLFNKSSLARLGLMNSPDACWIDAGWSGVLTMEFFNSSGYAIKLSPEMRIGQMVFFEHQSCEKPYRGKYYKQSPGSGSRGSQ